MTRDDIMAPFRMRFSGAFIHQDLRMTVEVKETQKSAFAPKELPIPQDIDAAIEALRAALAQATIPGWRYNPYSGDPKTGCPPEPEGMTADHHHARIDAVVDILTTAGVQRASEARHLPAGWTTVLEVASKAIAARMALPDAGPVSIAQMKEKFGSLRFYLHLGGDEPEGEEFRRDIRQIAQWAEGVTEGRCAVTGKPAEADTAGWILYLTPWMAGLRKVDPKAFGDLIYPPPPVKP